jgi:outer membrane protein OmpA-like peptidoglycan-associated protein
MFPVHLSRFAAARLLSVALALTVTACASPDGKVGAGDGPLGVTKPTKAQEPAPKTAPPAVGGAEGTEQPGDSAALLLDRRNNVYFAQGSAEIDGAGRETLRQHAEKLKSDRRLMVMLISYPADRGSTEYKIALGQKRVDSVADELRAGGVATSQMRKQSYGSERANSDRCKTEACRESDRRVELRYLDIKTAPTRRVP